MTDELSLLMNVFEASWNWGLLGMALAVGLAVGALLVFLLVCRSARVAKLREELERTRAEHEVYRRQVHEHFGKTSVLFQQMTTSYRAVYEHLADGCETLCNDATLPGQLELPRTQAIGADKEQPSGRIAAPEPGAAEGAGAAPQSPEPSNPPSSG